MFNERNNFDWEAHNRQLVRDGTAILERTGESITRSNQIAIETENIGHEVINELGSQRESLLRTRGTLEDTNVQLDTARSMLNKMGRNIVYNKIILILIIILEIMILIALSCHKFIK